MMPSHCRCEGPGLGKSGSGAWRVGREEESESHRCRSAQRSAAERTSTSILPGFGRHDSGLGLLATHPTRPLRGPATALSTDARSLMLIDLCSTTRLGAHRRGWKRTRRDLAVRTYKVDSNKAMRRRGRSSMPPTTEEEYSPMSTTRN